MSQNEYIEKPQFKSAWFNRFIDELTNTKVVKEDTMTIVREPKLLSTEQKYSMIHEALTDAFNYIKLQNKYDGQHEKEEREEDYL